jgi:hypothetical protein
MALPVARPPPELPRLPQLARASHQLSPGEGVEQRGGGGGVLLDRGVRIGQGALERGPCLAGAGEALAGLLRQQAHDDRVQRPGQAGPVRARRNHGACTCWLTTSSGRVPVKGRRPVTSS